MTNVLQFKKEKQSVGSITIDIKTEILEDDSVWYCMKMSTEVEWGEWVKLEMETIDEC